MSISEETVKNFVMKCQGIIIIMLVYKMLFHNLVQPKSCLCFSDFFLTYWKVDTQISSGLILSCLQKPRLGQAGLGPGSPVCISQMSGRDPATWTVTCCHPCCMVAGSWSWEQSWDMNLGTLIGNVSQGAAQALCTGDTPPRTQTTSKVWKRLSPGNTCSRGTLQVCTLRHWLISFSEVALLCVHT